MVKLLISVYDRPEYLKKSLDSLTESFDVLCPEIVIVDDGSSLPETQCILNDFLRINKDYPSQIEINKWDHRGIPFCKLEPIRALLTLRNLDKSYFYKEEFFLVTDSDMIYKKGWADKLVDLYRRTGAPLITGFNTLTNKHNVIKEFDDYVIKESVGGCNLLVDSSFYRKHPFTEEKEWDYRMCERAHEYHKPGIVATKPSVVDHIGVKGHWARTDYHDKAIDF